MRWPEDGPRHLEPRGVQAVKTRLPVRWGCFLRSAAGELTAFDLYAVPGSGRYLIKLNGQDAGHVSRVRERSWRKAGAHTEFWRLDGSPVRYATRQTALEALLDGRDRAQ